MADFPVIFNGNKYDITKFVRDHPGGVNTLRNYKGKSIQHAMEKFGHSNSAYHMLKDFKITRELDSNLTGVSENGRIITKEETNRDEKEIAFLEELESRLDWSKPLIAQLDKIAPHYNEWVNSAVYRRCRLFANPLLESLTFTPWYIVPAFWIPVILYLTYTQYMIHVRCGNSCAGSPLSLFYFIYHMALGLLIWSSLEYTLHRWVFHLNPGSNITMIKLQFLLHGLHHKMPFDGLRQAFPVIPALVIAYVIYYPLSCCFSYPLIKLTGGLCGYLSYDMIHFYVHYGSPKDGSYLYAMKRYHSNHHFVNHDKAFGVSSKLWDHVFRTLAHVKKLDFSLKW